MAGAPWPLLLAAVPFGRMVPPLGMQRSRSPQDFLTQQVAMAMPSADTAGHTKLRERLCVKGFTVP